MKLVIKYTLRTLGLMLTFHSCSSDWLETDSTGLASENKVFETTANAKQAIGGICSIMINQHHFYEQPFNGEGTMKQFYGEYMGQDFNYPNLAPKWTLLMNGGVTQSASSIYGSYPWYYYYLIVGNANSVIAQIDKAQGTEAERQFIKAEALTLRAYAFSRLATIYCDSWAKSNKGASTGIVLRLDESLGDMPFSTLAQTYVQIYTDLDAAIKLYQQSGLTRDAVYAKTKDTNSFPDIHVAYGIYARAALDRADYTNALQYAQLAREGYNLMSVDDYRSGFCKKTSEWIWGLYNDSEETLFGWSWQVTMACNGYNAQNGINICINRRLIETFPESDIRKSLFLTESRFLPEGKIYLEVVAGDEGGSDNGCFTDEEAYNRANTYVKTLVSNAPEQPFAYASLKFQSTAQPGVGCQPLIRSSEMVLIEAEANFFLNRIPAAQANVMELNVSTKRDPSYSCTKTGESLLEEIKRYRRLELFGEGFSWFDCKRWGDEVIRPSFEDGGNYFSTIAGSFGDKETFWKWMVPEKETEYNKDI